MEKNCQKKKWTANNTFASTARPHTMANYKYRTITILAIATARMIGLFYAKSAGMNANGLFFVSAFFIFVISGIDVFVFDSWPGGKNWKRTTKN